MSSANAISAQAHAVYHPPAQTQDRVAQKHQNQNPSAVTPSSGSGNHKVDIKV